MVVGFFLRMNQNWKYPLKLTHLYTDLVIIKPGTSQFHAKVKKICKQALALGASIQSTPNITAQLYGASHATSQRNFGAQKNRLWSSSTFKHIGTFFLKYFDPGLKGGLISKGIFTLVQSSDMIQISVSFEPKLRSSQIL